MRPAIRHLLLVNPWIHDFAVYDLWAKPLGLLYVASMLKGAGVSMRFVDLLGSRRYRIQPAGCARIEKQLLPLPEPLQGHGIQRPYFRYGLVPEQAASALRQGPTPDVVLVTTHMTYWYPGVQETIGLIRSLYGSVPILLGGIYATLCPDHAKRLGADLVVTGPAEDSLSQALATVSGMDAEQSILQPIEIEEGRWVRPAYGLVANPRYGCLLTSRGCPHRCAYCASHRLWPHPPLRRKPQDAIDEIVHFRDRLGLRHFAIYDDAFLSLGRQLLEPIARSGLGVQLHCPNGLEARCIDNRVARLLREGGFTTLRIGLEAANLETQVRTGFKVTHQEFVAAVQCLIEQGFDPAKLGVYLMVGLPGQTLAEVRHSITYVRSSGLRVHLNEYSPIPGTELFEQEQQLCGRNLAQEPLWHNNSLMPYRSPRFDPGTFRQLRQEAGLLL